MIAHSSALDDKIVVYVIGALVAGFAIGRYRRFLGSDGPRYQNRGETLVAQLIQANFGPPSFHLMNHLTIPLRDGTTQIDHVLVSRYGVFVIETKNYSGWIFGDAKDETWTQVQFRLKYKFQNPIFQNYRHIQAVRGLLDFLPADAVRSLVVFTGTAEFKTPVPQEVVYLSDLLSYLRRQTALVMSQNRMQFCVGRLETARLALSEQTDIEHIQSLQRRHGGPRPHEPPDARWRWGRGSDGRWR